MLSHRILQTGPPASAHALWVRSRLNIRNHCNTAIRSGMDRTRTINQAILNDRKASALTSQRGILGCERTVLIVLVPILSCALPHSDHGWLTFGDASATRSAMPDSSSAIGLLALQVTREPSTGTSSLTIRSSLVRVSGSPDTCIPVLSPHHPAFRISFPIADRSGSGSTDIAVTTPSTSSSCVAYI